MSEQTSVLDKVAPLTQSAIHLLNHGQSVLALLFRFYLANVFFSSGLTKIQSWNSTLELFAYEYAVPLIPSELAAYMATGAELLLPVLLVFGLGARFSAAGLFVLNFVAAISYPDISPAGMKDHYLWGVMCLSLFFYGPGKAAVDHFVAKRYSA